MPVVSLGREILGAGRNLQGSGPARCPGWRRWPWGQTGGQRSQRTGHLPHGCPREPLWEPGPLGPRLLAVRAHSYSMSTCDVAVLPEAGLVTEEGLAQSLCEWESLTPGVTISVLQAEAGHPAQSPCPLAA